MKYRQCLDTMVPYQAGKKKEGAIKLSSNENPLGTSPNAMKAMQNTLNDIAVYPDGFAMDLKKKLAEKYGLGTDQIAIGNGSDELFALAAGMVVNPGDKGITGLNTFSEYAFSVRMFGGEMIKVPLLKGCYDLPSILNSVTQDTRIIYLCNPNNPTGTIFGHNEVSDFMNRVSEDILVILDEAYHDYVEADHYPDAMKLVQEHANLLVTRTFSKIYGLAAARIGWGFAQKDLITQLHKLKQAFNVNQFALSGAKAALDDTAFYEKTLVMNRKGKTSLYKSLGDLGMDFYETEGNFICINTRKKASRLFHIIGEKGMTIRPLDSFGLPNSIRYTISTEEHNRLFIKFLTEALQETEDVI